jgi:hypothetical protein
MPEPTVLPDAGFAVQQFGLDRDGTRFIVLTVECYEGVLVCAEPIAVRPARGWFLFGSTGVLAQTYVAEKLGIDPRLWTGPDARTLTELIGYALDREVMLLPLD